MINRILVQGFRGILSGLISLSILLWGMPAIAADIQAIDTSSAGVQIFEIHCAGCHLNGGNIVRRGKTLKQKALQRNGYDSLDAIRELVTQGKGNMSAYRDRLTPEDIQTVSAYVLEQAKRNW